MIRTTTLAFALLAGVSLPAMATRQEPPRQTGGATSAQATAQASSVAGAAASNRTSVRSTTYNSASGGGGGFAQASGGAGGTGGAANAGGGTSSATIQNSAPSSQTIRMAPDVTAPAIWSNNPCTIAASGGVSGLGWGVAIGAGIEDADCTRRANAQHLAAMGEREAAREVLCGSREVREAFARIGRPCAADVPRVQSVSVQPRAVPVERPAPVNTSGLSDDACRTLRQRGMDVRGCP